MSETLAHGGASATSEQPAPASNGVQGGGLEDLRVHIQENFGDSLAPILERVLFQRGWQNCTLDEFYQNLNNNSSTIVAECRRNISENELVISIEENLLRALFMGHGQNAVQMVQALRYYPLEDRFLAMVSPVALAKLLSGLNQARQQGQSPVSSNGAQRAGSFASGPQTPVSGSGQQGAYSSSNTSQPQYNGQPQPQQAQAIPKDANYPQQPQGSPNHRVQPPTGGYNNHGAGGQQPTSQPTPTHTASGNSWGIGGHGNGPTQQLSPYPNNRQQPNHQGNQHSNNHHMQQNQQQNQQQMPQSYGSNNGGPQFPQANSFESEGSHGSRRGGHHHQHQNPQHPAPPAPAPLFYDGEGGHPPNAIGSTPTSQGAPQQMSWADEAEQEEYNKQQQQRNEAELKEFLDTNNSSQLFNVLKKYSLTQLQHMSPKIFEAELKRLICSSNARKSLMDLLHPDGVLPEEPVELPASPQEEPAHYQLHQDPAQRQHQQAMAAREAQSRGKNQGQTYGKDVASTNAILDTLKLGGTPEKAGRGAKRGGNQEEGSPTGKGMTAVPASRGGIKGSNSTGNLSNGSPVTTPNSKDAANPNATNLNSRLFYDDDPAYQAQQNAPRSPPSKQRNDVPARGQGRGKPGHSDSDFTPTTSPAKGSQGGNVRSANSTLVLKGVKGVSLEIVANAVGRMAQVVDFKHGHDDDEAEFLLSSHSADLYHTRVISFRVQQQNHKARIVSLKKGQEHRGNNNPPAPNNAATLTSICKYFNNSHGCQRGESCKFSHIAENVPPHGKFKGRGGDRGHHEKAHEDTGVPSNRGGGKRGGGLAASPVKPRSLQERDVATPGSGGGSQQDLTPQDQSQQQGGSPLEHHQHPMNGSGSRPASNLASPQKKISTPIDEIPKPRSFQEAMHRNSARNSPIPTHGGSPNGQLHPQYPGAAPQYNQAPPPPPPNQPAPGYYGGPHDQGQGPQTPVYEEAQHHTVPHHGSHHGSPTQQMAPQMPVQQMEGQ